MIEILQRLCSLLQTQHTASGYEAKVNVNNFFFLQRHISQAAHKDTLLHNKILPTCHLIGDTTTVTYPEVLELNHLKRVSGYMFLFIAEHFYCRNQKGS